MSFRNCRVGTLENFESPGPTSSLCPPNSATVGQTIGLTVGNVLDEMMDLDLFNSDFDSMIGVTFSLPVGKVKTSSKDLTWLDPKIFQLFIFNFSNNNDCCACSMRCIVSSWWIC